MCRCGNSRVIIIWGAINKLHNLKVAIVDYGMGNLFSVRKAFAYLGTNVSIISDSKEIYDADAIILPGVGAFGKAMQNLAERDLIRDLTCAVKEKKIPFLGICLGMQLLAKRSPEMGEHKGLGWLDAEVERIRSAPGIRIPHVSWNRIAIRQDTEFLQPIKFSDTFYFDHSFQFTAVSEGIVAYSDYHGIIPAVIQCENIFATQFHPEKSQRSGLVLLKNFLSIVKKYKK